MTFILLILLTAFLMEGIGSYISVVGLSALFSGDWVIIAMAVILDIAKVTTVSFIYQYWTEIRKSMRAYMTTAVLVLMLITSAGAFGYLSGAFQKAIQPNREIALKVGSLTREMSALEAEKKELTDVKLKISQQIANVPTSTEDTARRRLISSFKPELDRASKRLDIVNKRVDELRSEVLRAQSENVEKDVHAGPITYVSQAFGVSMEDASKYIIILIVLVFDPLAIMLVIAGNFLITRRQDEQEAKLKAPELQPVESPIALKPIHDAPGSMLDEVIDDPIVLEPKRLNRSIKRAVDEVEETPKRVKVAHLKPTEQVPVIEVTAPNQPDIVRSELISEPLPMGRSLLEGIKIGIEDALFKHGVTPFSKKRAQYEAI